MPGGCRTVCSRDAPTARRSIDSVAFLKLALRGKPYSYAMSNLAIVFYVLGALFALYVIAATWKSRDATLREPEPRR